MMLGDIRIILSWYGNPSDGVWALNFPYNMRSEFGKDKDPIIEWRVLSISSAEEAKRYAEDYFVKELLITKYLIDKSFDNASEIGKPIQERLVLTDGEYKTVKKND